MYVLIDVLIVFNNYSNFFATQGKPKFIKAWIIFQLVIAALMFIGALIYTVALPISMSSIMSGWLVLPPVILIYCYIGKLIILFILFQNTKVKYLMNIFRFLFV